MVRTIYKEQSAVENKYRGPGNNINPKCPGNDGWTAPTTQRDVTLLLKALLFKWPAYIIKTSLEEKPELSFGLFF